MKKILFALLALFSITLGSCFFDFKEYQKRINDYEKRHDNAWEGRRRRIEEVRNISFEKASQRVALGNVIRVGIVHAERESLDKVKQYLEEGYDPNRTDGEEWWERTPFLLVAGGFYNTWLSINSRVPERREIPDPPPDIEVFQLLVDAGADVNQQPYIWFRVYRHGNDHIDLWIRHIDLWARDAERRLGESPLTKKEETEREKEQMIFYLVNDANRVLEAFLKAGADPDKLGHPYPFSPEATIRWISDEEANEHFAKGTRPINEAIKKGIRWESQVDLLLQYTTLDEDSLKAARESKDPAMIAKITRLWNEQNAGR